ncbi:MAG TPA: DPP IV N-terminal domain-containing protein [Solirubrobacteraceae bacterium]|jgi:Tol biopolymer transport system component/endonuclease YncB( thermonuclease family)
MTRRPAQISVPAALLAAFALLGAADRTPAAVPGTNGKIAFVRTVAPGDTEIYAMAADGGGVARLTTSPGEDADPAWSPGGTKLAFTSDRAGNEDVYVMNADGGGVRRLTDSPGDDADPAWSPDGRRIAFTSDRDGDQEVYVMNADGTGEADLTNSPAITPSAAPGARTFGNDSAPAWSPDGTRIAFTSDRDGDDEIYAMNADGAGQVDLTDAPDAQDEAPAFSPDGKAIAFQSSQRDAGDGIYVMNADGSAVRSLADADVADEEPAFSPDGTLIVYSAPFGVDGDGVYAMGADGSSPTLLSASRLGDSSPDWQRCTTCSAGSPAPGGAPASDGFGGTVPVLPGGLAALLRPGGGTTGSAQAGGRVAVAVRVVSVLAGDAIRVAATDRSRVRVTVRLLGIQAPAPRRCGGAASRRALARLAPRGRRLSLVVRAGARRDAAGRLAALVATASGKQLQVAQLQAGWARTRRSDAGLTTGVKRAFAAAQRRARAQRRGVWSLCGGRFR